MLLLVLGACRTLQSFDTPLEPDYAWERAEPDSAMAERFEAARVYHEANAGLAMPVVHGDQLVYEEYYNGHSASTPHPLWSGTKTFTCALALKAVEQGVLDLDEAVSNTFESFAEGDRSNMTVRHLLNFTSGLEDNNGKLTWDGFFATEDQRHDDKYAIALDQPLLHAPGTVYEYGAVHLMVFGALMEAKLGTSPLDWLEAQVLDPIGFRYAGWSQDPDGNPMFPYGAWTTASEWARFAVLLRDDGMWEGERVLPEGTLEACRTGSEANPAYGLGAWLNREVPSDLDLSHIAHFEDEGPVFWQAGPTDMLVAAGARGQRAYVLPSEDMVVILQTDSNDFADNVFLSTLLRSD